MYTLVGDVDNGEAKHMGGRIIWKISVPFIQFYCKFTKSARKYNVYYFKIIIIIYTLLVFFWAVRTLIVVQFFLITLRTYSSTLS